MKAVGAYLQTLREGRGLSRPWVAERAGTNGTNIYRIETLGQEPRPRMLIGFVRAVQGSFDDIDELLEDDNLPVDVGVELARRRLDDAHTAAYAETKANGFVEKVGRDRAEAIARQLSSDPGFVEAIRRLARSIDD